MNFLKNLKALSRFELLLWIISLITVSISFLASKKPDYLTLIASLTGVTALIFVAKGYVLGQLLTVIFAVFYGIISFEFKYYGEMITYLFMTAPMAVMAVISWVKHPFKNGNEVEVNRLSKGSFILGIILSLVVTAIFFFVLRALGNANLLTSTLSVTTSFLASYLTFVRSPYYALAYGANDIVLIVLWIMASISTPSYLPMVFCFLMFLVNDLYGFYNWNKMLKNQSKTDFHG